MTRTSQLDQVSFLNGHAPYTLAGYARFREIIDSDGAVPARLKALFASVAAIDRRYPDLARRELARGAALGLTVREVTAGMIVLASLRGEGAAIEFAGVVADIFASPGAPTAEPAGDVAPGEAEANFRSYFGTIPAPLAQLIRLVPAAADAYYLMRRGSIDANPISAKEGELLLLAILAAGYSPMAATHVRGARNAGATDEEIAEAVLCAVPSAGIAAWMAVGAMLEPVTPEAAP
jgi:alkylhydroperoxidase/carboxymuconolactone decarboxylase family protein YurZ